ncbi:MAG: S8 family serine peptidase [bacterium]
MKRFAAALSILVLVPVLLSGDPAGAVTIDPGLSAALAAKTYSGKVPVLLVFDDPAAAGDLVGDLDRLDPAGKRGAVLQALKQEAHEVQRSVLAELEDPRWAGQVGRVHALYLAGAVAFTATPAVIEALAQLPDAAVMHEDRIFKLTDAAKGTAAPGLARKTAAAVDTVWSVKYIDADRVWNELGITGQGIVVGHIDTGIYLTHPDLANRLWTNEGEVPGNGIDDDANGFVDDVHGWDFGADDNDPNDDSADPGHGTHTAGSVVGDGSGGTLTGVAPGARVMGCKVWQDNGLGGSLGMIWAAEQYCVENGARIITMSLGIPGNIAPIFMRNERINCNNIRDAGVLLVNSAGNDHILYDPPIELSLSARVPAPWNALPVPYSSTSGVLTVGATNFQSDSIYLGSSQGPAHWGDVDPWNDWAYNPGPGLTKPDVVAPGANVNSLVIPSGYSGNTWTGTSMACPHVAGVAALMLEKNPSLSPAGLDSLLELTARDLGFAGKDNVFGSGQINAWAAVNAVPAGLSPNLNFAGILPDFPGDMTLDPGETSLVAFQLLNSSPGTAAGGISATLGVLANDHVTVTDGEGTFEAIAAGGAMGDNQNDPFALEVDAEAPQGYPFTLVLTVSSGDFVRTFDIPWYVGLPEFRTHDVGHVYLTVTDQGVLGYMGQDGADGDGMGVRGGLSNLFIGSFWAGTGSQYVCNRDYDGLGAETHEWVVSNNKDDSGRVRDLGALSSDQTFRAVFHDGGHTSPMPLKVEQNSYAFSGSPNEDFVILKYTLTNQGQTPVTGLYAGVFCDFDIGDSATNLGNTDAGRNLAYIFSGVGPFFGIAYLDTAPAVNLSLVNNQQYVYPTSRITDADKFGFLSGSLRTSIARTGDDWSVMASAVVDLQPGVPQDVVFALIYGETLADVQANTDAAFLAYGDVLVPTFLSLFDVTYQDRKAMVTWQSLIDAEPSHYRLTRTLDGQEQDLAFARDTEGVFEAVDADLPTDRDGTALYSLYHGTDELDWRILAQQEVDFSEAPPIRAQLTSYPNPFNPQATIRYAVAEAGPMELAVYNLRGEKLRVLFSGHHAAGEDQIAWDGSDDRGNPLPSGIYLYRMTTAAGTLTRKMTMVR